MCFKAIISSELGQHPSWWKGPAWLRTPQNEWPSTQVLVDKPVLNEGKEIPPEISMVSVTIDLPIVQKMSSFNRLRRVTAWILQFVHNSRASKNKQAVRKGMLETNELNLAEERWIASTKQTAYPEELSILGAGKELYNKQLLPLSLFIDPRGLLCVGSRISLAQQPYERCHPLIIPGKHLLQN